VKERVGTAFKMAQYSDTQFARQHDKHGLFYLCTKILSGKHIATDATAGHSALSSAVSGHRMTKSQHAMLEPVPRHTLLTSAQVNTPAAVVFFFHKSDLTNSMEQRPS
jgi:hypothetical protein